MLREPRLHAVQDRFVLQARDYDLTLTHIVHGYDPRTDAVAPTVRSLRRQINGGRIVLAGQEIFEPSLAYQRYSFRWIDWKGSRHALCSNNRLVSPGGRLACVIRDSS